jgi:coenzyme F420-dependent glucose-6-phosphate dehydrogenase
MLQADLTNVALGMTTQRMTFGPDVTCASYRYHPAILAQAAAALAAMCPGHFWFGIGTGEALNEHIVGGEWPDAPVRLERVIESIAIIKNSASNSQLILLLLGSLLIQ